MRPKTCEIAVQNHLNCKKARTSNFDDPTTLFQGPERSGRSAEGQVGAHFGCAESKLELRRPPWSPNRLGQCSQCRLYKAKWLKRRPRLQVEPKRRPRRPSWTEEAPERLQVGPKRRPRGSKLSPRGVQELQVEPKRRPRAAQEAPSWTL